VRHPVLFLLALLPLVLVGCPIEPIEELADITWEPELTSSNGGVLDFGEVEINNSAQENITGTNNTEETITFELDVDLDAADGWLFTAWQTVDVAPGDQASFGPRFNPNNSTPDVSTGSAAFLWEDHVVTYIIRGAVPE
jgi:hypothetical protein